MKSEIRVASIIMAIILAGCSNLIQPPTSQAPASSSVETKGTLSIDVPSIASWLKPYLVEPEGKALLRATSVKVYVKTSGGTNVISPVTQTLSITSASGGSGSALTPITGVPEGTNYTVSIEVYNSSYSTSSPTVTGSVAGVNVIKDQTTSVTITCLPSSTSTLPYNVTTTSSIAASSERWYSFTTVPGKTHEFSQASANMPGFVFSNTGAYLGSFSQGSPYTLDLTGSTTAATYYVGVSNTGSATAVSSVSFAVAIPPANEGSISSPVVLTEGALKSLKVGVAGASDKYSYYSFTPTESGDYYWEGTASISASYRLGTSADSSSYLVAGSYFSGAWFTNLISGTTYYIRLESYTATSTTYNATILSPSAISTLTKAEGRPYAPVSLTIDLPRSGKVGYYRYSGSSYYEFTTGSGALYQVNVTGITGAATGIEYAVKDMSRNPVAAGSSSTAKTLILAPNTKYLLQTSYSGTISDYTNAGQTTYTLAVNNASAPSSTTLTANTPYQGSITTGGTTAYYSVTLMPGTYAIAWEDSYNKAAGTAATLDIDVSAYSGDYRTSYFYQSDAGYPTPQSITVTGTTAQTVNLVVRAYAGSTSTGTFWLTVSVPSLGNLNITVQ